VRALIIGDSHVDWGRFGKALQTKLQQAGYQVTRAGAGGTSAASWASGKACTPNKSKCVNVSSLKGPWDLVLISLGTNDAANGNKAGKLPARAVLTANRISQIAAKLGGKRTIWILPPVLRGNIKWYTQPAANAIYKAAPQARVELFDSRTYTGGVITEKSGDGVHPGPKVAEKWASGVAQQASRRATANIWLVAVALGVIGAFLLA
jgi:lysophospholipase L1-like esterase